jgi:hypothetical protein
VRRQTDDQASGSWLHRGAELREIRFTHSAGTGLFRCARSGRRTRGG